MTSRLRAMDRVPIKRFERPEPNELWQMDLMEQEDVGLGRVHLVAVLDDRSRYLVAGRFSPSRATEVVLGVLAEALEMHGLPEAILTDRGKQFCTRADLQGPQSLYQLILDLLGIKPVYARAYHPRTKGKVEKFFQLVQRDFLSEVRGKVGSLCELNQLFDGWRKDYNERHSHSSLGGKPPAAFYRSSSRQSPLDVTALCRVQYRRRVTKEAMVRYRGRKYSVPPTFIGDHVWLAVTDKELVVESRGHVIARHPLVEDDTRAAA